MVNHASGRNLLKPIDRQAVIATLRQWLSENYHWAMHYFNIKPRVMVEQPIDDGHADGPLDYRIWCFEGKPEAIQMDNKPPYAQRRSTIQTGSRLILFFGIFWLLQQNRLSLMRLVSDRWLPSAHAAIKST